MAGTILHNQRRISGTKARAALGCALLAVPAIMGSRPAQAQTFKVLYTFGTNGEFDASLPRGSLLLSGGSLYGTTYGGGGARYNSDGTVFQVVTATGQETLLYRFAASSTDGANPLGGVIRDSAGNFYGTTYYGGSNNNGTIFKVTTMDKEVQLHSFTGPDGTGPIGTLVADAQGNLYGVTVYGGASNVGTVFKLDTAKLLTTLHAFAGPDGESPGAGLLLEKGHLFGTTYYGGASNYGTVFQVNLATGQETVVYSFTGGAAGEGPVAGLVGDGAGNLYGTTAFGGTGYGVVFKLDLATGQETVIHTFTGADGSLPESGLVRDSSGNLYGTTYSGGASGGGTVFKLDNAGNFTTLHSFIFPADGANPLASLILDSQGNIYGSALTSNYTQGGGTIFEITP